MMNTNEPLKILAEKSAMPQVLGALSRRRFLSLGALAGGSMLLTACAAGQDTTTTKATGGELEDSLSVYSWGDYDDPDLLKGFTKELGPTVRVDSFGSNEELISKLVAARGTGGYDIVVPTGEYIPEMAKHDLFMKLNKKLIPNLEYMDPEFLAREWDPDNDYSICKAWGTTGFVYDTTVIKRELKDWNDFIDCAKNEASGKTSVLDDPAEVAGLYFWANDIDWTTTDKAELDKCEDFLVNDLAPHVAAFDSYPGSGSIPQASHRLIQVWNGDARQGMLSSKDPERWKWVLGAPKTELWMDNWAISATSQHPEAAHAFLNFMLEPDNQLTNVDYIGYHTGAKDIEDDARKEGFEMIDMIFFTPEQLKTMDEGEMNEAVERKVDIYNKMKAAASA
jgi:spermidine/putrescine transport system substrate-binding protein